MLRRLLILLVVALMTAAASAQPPACEDTILTVTKITPMLDTPFFHKADTSYQWWISEDDSGHLEDTIDQSIDADDLLRVEHSANCISPHQVERKMELCEAV